MTDSPLQRKAFVSGLIEVICQGIAHNRLDDAQALLSSVRVLRPQLPELDTFEAWIAMKRGLWTDAIRMLHHLDASTSNWSLGKALLAFCQFATGDAAWRISANEVLEHGQNEEAVRLVTLLLNPNGDDAASGAAHTSAGAVQPALPEEALREGAYLRA